MSFFNTIGNVVKAIPSMQARGPAISTGNQPTGMPLNQIAKSLFTPAALPVSIDSGATVGLSPIQPKLVESAVQDRSPFKKLNIWDLISNVRPLK